MAGETIYTEDIANAIYDRISGRETLGTICGSNDMPARSTVYRWLKERPEFHARYKIARQNRADARADNIDEICALVREGLLDDKAARVLISAEQWQAGKENPSRYGDKTQLTGPNGDDPVQIKMSETEVAARIAFILARGIDQLSSIEDESDEGEA